jgi:hypothetical protein
MEQVLRSLADRQRLWPRFVPICDTLQRGSDKMPIFQRPNVTGSIWFIFDRRNLGSLRATSRKALPLNLI